MKELLEGICQSLEQLVNVVQIQNQTMQLLVERNHHLMLLVLEQRESAPDDTDDSEVYDLKGNRVQ